MAKRLHRTFEIFDFRDEALRALTPKSVSPVTDSALPKSSTYNYLAISHLAAVTHVEFKRSQALGEETASDLSKDFAQLAANLAIDSKVLLDFSNIKSFCAANVDELVLLNKGLRHKGSRVVLCCLDSEAIEHFYPNVTPGQQSACSN